MRTSVWIYTMKVVLKETPVHAPMRGEVTRTLQILGNQTLEQLHHGIRRAFRYEGSGDYQFAGYKSPEFQKKEGEGVTTTRPGDPAHTSVESLGLKKGARFYYHYDVDLTCPKDENSREWGHEIGVTAIRKGPGSGQYPKIIGETGIVPPLFTDYDGVEQEGEPG